MPHSYVQIIEGPNGKPLPCRTLILKPHEMNGIVCRLRFKEIAAAEEAAELALHAQMRKTSDGLKSSWIAKMKAIEEQERAEKEEQVRKYLADKAAYYQGLIDEKENEKRQYIETCNTMKFYGKAHVNLLNKALVESDTLLERAAQVELQTKRRELEERCKAAYAEKVRKDVEAFRIETEEAKRKEYLRNQEYKAVLLGQLKENQERDLAMETNRIMIEKYDMQCMEKEIRDGKLKAAQEKHRHFLETKAVVTESLEDHRRARESEMSRAAEFEREMEAFAAAKQKMAKVCKDREQEYQDEQISLRDKMRLRLGIEQKSNEDKENAILRKAIAERDAKDEEARQEKEDYQKQLVAEKIQDYKDHLAAAEQRRIEESNLKKWETLQRFNTDLVNREFIKTHEVNKKNLIRDEYLKDIAVHKASQERLRQEDQLAAEMEAAYWVAEDEDYLDYADSILEESRVLGRPLYPIEKEIARYQFENGIAPKKATGPAFKSQIELGTSQHKKKSGQPSKKLKAKRRPIDKNTLPSYAAAQNSCTCGPITCMCPPSENAHVYDTTFTSCTCGPIICMCTDKK